MTDEPDDVSEEEFDRRAAAEWFRIQTAPLVRRFPFLGGWAILLMPLDVFPYRGMAGMFVGEFFGFKPADITHLRARRYKHDDDDQERTYWVLALSPESVRRWNRRAARSRLKRMKDKGTTA